MLKHSTQKCYKEKAVPNQTTSTLSIVPETVSKIPLKVYSHPRVVRKQITSVLRTWEIQQHTWPRKKKEREKKPSTLRLELFAFIRKKYPNIARDSSLLNLIKVLVPFKPAEELAHGSILSRTYIQDLRKHILLGNVAVISSVHDLHGYLSQNQVELQFNELWITKLVGINLKDKHQKKNRTNLVYIAQALSYYGAEIRILHLSDISQFVDYKNYEKIIRLCRPHLEELYLFLDNYLNYLQSSFIELESEQLKFPKLKKLVLHLFTETHSDDETKSVKRNLIPFFCKVAPYLTDIIIYTNNLFIMNQAFVLMEKMKFGYFHLVFSSKTFEPECNRSFLNYSQFFSELPSDRRIHLIFDFHVNRFHEAPGWPPFEDYELPSSKGNRFNCYMDSVYEEDEDRTFFFFTVNCYPDRKYLSEA